MSSISSLPTELLKIILMQLSPSDILLACSINVDIHQQLCNDESFWQDVSQLHYPDLKPYSYQTWHTFVLFMVKNSKTVPVYKYSGAGQYELIAELRLYGDTEVRKLDTNNSLSKIVYNIQRTSILPILDSRQEHIFGPTVHNIDHHIEFIVEGDGIQGLFYVVKINEYDGITHKIYSQLEGYRRAIPTFFIRPGLVSVDTFWRDHIKTHHNVTLSQIPFAHIITKPNPNIPRSLSLFDVIVAVFMG